LGAVLRLFCSILTSVLLLKTDYHKFEERTISKRNQSAPEEQAEAHVAGRAA
jgi:hypothetical protein